MVVIPNIKTDTFSSYICPIVSYSNDGFIGRFEKVYTKTVGQFTGLTDKNGKEIYEYDIVLTQNNTTRIIAYENAAFHVNGENEGKKVSHPLYYQCIMQKGSKIDFEIIGNIHDNSELLK